MRYQKGFVPLVVIIVLVAVGLVTAGGGYVIYKDKQQEKKNREYIQNLQNSQTETQNQTMATEPQTRDPEPQKTSVNTSISTKVSMPITSNCDNNWQCLISAANQCQSAIGTVSYNNVPNPLIPGLLNSGRTKYEVKKSGNSCTVVYSIISASLAISANGRSKALADGSTNSEIDAQLQAMNDSFKNVIGLPTTCTASGSAIASYLTDTKNGTAASGEFSFSADFSNSSSQSTVTTSSGQKLTCTTQQPVASATTYSSATTPSISLSSNTYGDVAKGTAVSITLNAQNVDYCDAPGALNGKTSGTATFYPTETTTYTALCYDKIPTDNYTKPKLQTSITIKVSP